MGFAMDCIMVATAIAIACVGLPNFVEAVKEDEVTWLDLAGFVGIISFGLLSVANFAIGWMLEWGAY